MGVKDGDNLIVTTEMKLPLDQYSNDDDIMDTGGSMFQSQNPIDDPYEISNAHPPNLDFGKQHNQQAMMRDGEMRMQNDPFSNNNHMGQMNQPNPNSLSNPNGLNN